MKKLKQKTLCMAVVLLVMFMAWTVLVKNVDVRAIGPDGSSVGLAEFNGFFHKTIGVRMSLYNITDWLSIIPLCFVVGFSMLGLVQWIKRKKIQFVDYSLLVLGVFYIIVFGLYLLFEVCVINYRPVLINNVFEASYPSSTTMLVLCVLPTAIMQFNSRIKNEYLKNTVGALLIGFTVFMVVGRVLSGVHWFTDFVGGILLSAGLVVLYYFVLLCKKQSLS